MYSADGMYRYGATSAKKAPYRLPGGDIDDAIKSRLHGKSAIAAAPEPPSDILQQLPPAYNKSLNSSTTSASFDANTPTAQNAVFAPKPPCEAPSTNPRPAVGLSHVKRPVTPTNPITELRVRYQEEANKLQAALDEDTWRNFESTEAAKREDIVNDEAWVLGRLVDNYNWTLEEMMFPLVARLIDTEEVARNKIVAEEVDSRNFEIKIGEADHLREVAAPPVQRTWRCYTARKTVAKKRTHHKQHVGIFQERVLLSNEVMAEERVERCVIREPLSRGLLEEVEVQARKMLMNLHKKQKRDLENYFTVLELEDAEWEERNDIMDEEDAERQLFHNGGVWERGLIHCEGGEETRRWCIEGEEWEDRVKLYYNCWLHQLGVLEQKKRSDVSFEEEEARFVVGQEMDRNAVIQREQKLRRFVHFEEEDCRYKLKALFTDGYVVQLIERIQRSWRIYLAFKKIAMMKHVRDMREQQELEEELAIFQPLMAAQLKREETAERMVLFDGQEMQRTAVHNTQLEERSRLVELQETDRRAMLSFNAAEARFDLFMLHKRELTDLVEVDECNYRNFLVDDANIEKRAILETLQDDLRRDMLREFDRSHEQMFHLHLEERGGAKQRTRQRKVQESQHREVKLEVESADFVPENQEEKERKEIWQQTDRDLRKDLYTTKNREKHRKAMTNLVNEETVERVDMEAAERVNRLRIMNGRVYVEVHTRNMAGLQADETKHRRAVAKLEFQEWTHMMLNEGLDFVQNEQSQRYYANERERVKIVEAEINARGDIEEDQEMDWDEIERDSQEFTSFITHVRRASATLDQAAMSRFRDTGDADSVHIDEDDEVAVLAAVEEPNVGVSSALPSDPILRQQMQPVKPYVPDVNYDTTAPVPDIDPLLRRTDVPSGYDPQLTQVDVQVTAADAWRQAMSAAERSTSTTPTSGSKLNTSQPMIEPTRATVSAPPPAGSLSPQQNKKPTPPKRKAPTDPFEKMLFEEEQKLAELQQQQLEEEEKEYNDLLTGLKQAEDAIYKNNNNTTAVSRPTSKGKGTSKTNYNAPRPPSNGPPPGNHKRRNPWMTYDPIGNNINVTDSTNTTTTTDDETTTGNYDTSYSSTASPVFSSKAKSPMASPSSAYYEVQERREEDAHASHSSYEQVQDRREEPEDYAHEVRTEVEQLLIWLQDEEQRDREKFQCDLLQNLAALSRNFLLSMRQLTIGMHKLQRDEEFERLKINTAQEGAFSMMEELASDDLRRAKRATDVRVDERHKRLQQQELEDLLQREQQYEKTKKAEHKKELARQAHDRRVHQQLCNQKATVIQKNWRGHFDREYCKALKSGDIQRAINFLTWWLDGRELLDNEKQLIVAMIPFLPDRWKTQAKLVDKALWI